MAHETTVPVKADIARSAEVPDLERYEEIYRKSLVDPDGYWAEQAETLHWEKRWDTVSAGGFADLDFTWFAGGRLNACHNAVDRHVEQHGERTAIIWAADEPGTYERISYRELKARVCRIANVLKQHGVKRGDRVCLYMPMIPDTAATRPVPFPLSWPSTAAGLFATEVELGFQIIGSRKSSPISLILS